MLPGATLVGAMSTGGKAHRGPVCGWRSAVLKCLPHNQRTMQALAALFMMNNAHFMVKTVEGSEALMLLGPDWLERQKDKVKPCWNGPAH